MLPPSRIPFTKPATDFTTQLQKLKDRGLEIDDDSRALRYLQNISYYRLSSYWEANLDVGTGNFHDGTTFDDIVKTYRFDKKLRILCLEAIERLEIAFRTQIIYHFTHDSGDSNWYEKISFFKNSTPQETNDSTRLINSIIGYRVGGRYYKGDLDKARDKLFIADYYRMYSTPVNPPAWMTLEVVTFGTLVKLFELFGNATAKGRIARHFNLPLSTFEAWMGTLGFIRNKCAHHERFWDLSIRPILPNTVAPVSPYWLANPNSTAKNNKIYYVLSVLNFLMVQVSPKSKFNNKVLTVMREHNIMQANWHSLHMGFPSEWDKETMWTEI